MANRVTHTFCWAALLAAVPAFSQISSETMGRESGAVASRAVAHVYVATPKGIDLYDAASNGKVTLVAGSPFPGNVTDMVTNGKYFYGIDDTYIYAYSVAASGALKRLAKFNPGVHSASGSGSPGYLDMDHIGATLYCNLYENDDEGIDYQAYNISKHDGDLTWLGNSDTEPARFGAGPLHILGNDKFAFQTQNYITWFTAGFSIGSNGALTGEIGEDVFPAAKPNDGYQSYVMAADPTDHLAVAVYPEFEPPSGSVDGPTQLGVYTSDNQGNLTTKSTFENMPVVQLGLVSDMNMSPSGKLLAVAGNGPGKTGLEVFHFNGASPITKYTGLITSVPIDQVHWDNANHLYAVSRAAGKLFVFTVTPTSVSEAPGSPYSISKPQRLIVRPE